MCWRHNPGVGGSQLLLMRRSVLLPAVQLLGEPLEAGALVAFEDEGFGVEPVEADEGHAGGVEEDFAAFEIGAAAVGTFHDDPGGFVVARLGVDENGGCGFQAVTDGLELVLHFPS